MITTVSLNPSIDKSIAVSEFHFGGMNRVLDVRRDAGGKAINVAVVAAGLDAQTECIGFLCRENAEIIEKRLSDVGVQQDFYPLEGAVRTNLKLLDRAQNVVTEINEPGARVDEETLAQMTEMIRGHAQKSDFMVLTGSLPPGCPKDYYALVIEELRSTGCRCVLDAEGESLRAGIQARPYLIKPNKMELELEMGRPLDSLADVARAARTYVARGVSLVAVSLGGEGALMTDGRATWYAPPMAVEVKSTVGAGDSMVAGMLSALLDGLTLDQVLRRGVACATASIMREGTRLMERATYTALLKRIVVEGMDMNG